MTHTINTIKRRRNILDYLRRNTAKRYLKKSSGENRKRYDQLAVFSFDGISHEIELFGQYEPHELECIRKNLSGYAKDKTILDIGANIGNHTVVFSKMAKNVIALEPNPVVYELLKINTRSLGNVQTYNFGASDTEANFPARIPVGNIGGGSVSINQDVDDQNAKFEQATFQVKILDDFSAIASSDVGLVKVDVEGHELNVFRGMKNILTRQKPVVLFELNRGIENATSQEVEFLRGIGYAYIYELVNAQSWITPLFLPRLIRRLLMLLEVIILGEPSRELLLKQIDKLDKKSYSLLVMSAGPLL